MIINNDGGVLSQYQRQYAALNIIALNSQLSLYPDIQHLVGC